MANPNQQFQQVIVPNPPRSRQDLSHNIKLDFDFGALIPNLLLEVVPGDAMKVSTSNFVRFMPMVFPILHEIDIYQHYFYVPWYMIWNKFEQFIVPQKDEGDGEGQTPIPLPPFVYLHQGLYSSSGFGSAIFGENSLWDYMGLPPVSSLSDLPLYANISPDQRIQLAPFLAYQLIYNEYYRDQNLVPKVNVEVFKDSNGSSGSYTISDLKDILTLRYRAWEKDLFTSSLPEPQKGPAQGINLTLGGAAADVVLNEEALASGYQILVDQNGEEVASTNMASDANGKMYNMLDPNGTMVAQFGDTSSANFTIEELRLAFRMQMFGEMLARGGSRLTEVIRSQFGVTPDDLTMSRPRYLGGGKQNVVISEVLQQSQTSSNSVLGEFAGHGISVGSANKFKAFFSHYGFVIGIMSVRPRTAYGQGVQPLFTKFDRYQYAWPHLSHLGEQPVRNGELWWSYTDKKNDDEFGYQPIYHDYRYIPSRLAGSMRSSLSKWHMNRLFANRPVLNKAFVEISPTETDGIFAVTEGAVGKHLVGECYHSIRAVRPLPKYGNPTL